MRFGARGHDFGRYTPEALADLYASYGIETVQLAVPKAIEGVSSYADADDKTLGRIKDALNAHGISISVLGCYIDPALPDKTARTAQLETFKRGIYCAAALGAECIGTETTVFSGDESERGAALDILSASLEELLTEASKYKVTVAVEPVTAHTMNSAALTAKLLKRFENSGLKAIFDPFNLLIPSKVQEQGKLWAECLELIGDSVMALHVKDARIENGIFKECELGEGVADYTVIADWLSKNKPDMAILREGTSPNTILQELNWMRRLEGGNNPWQQL